MRDDRNGESEPLARNSDPDTSHKAAESIKDCLSRMRQVAYDWIARFPDQTQAEIDWLAGNGKEHVLGKRFSELEKAGRIQVQGKRRCTVGLRMAQIYRVKEPKPAQQELF